MTDDDQTRAPRASGPTAAASTGAPAAAPVSGNALPPGTRLGEFELLAAAGEGGFSIVYRAWDHSLHRQVALKEYLPHAIAGRGDGLQVRVKSIRQQETFEAGLHSFVKEAQMLAQFDHPSLVKVFRFWEANGSAYMVMPFYEGRTLREELRQRGTDVDEATLLGWLGPVADALSVIHHAHWYHRDVAPDNVMLLAGTGAPLLLDFGAARQVIGDMTQALTVILKPGFAPLEQYGDIPGMRQGPWTDVYQLAAVAYYALTGRIPPAAVGRMLNDSFEPLTHLPPGRIGRHVLEALDHALAVRPEARTQNIAQFKEELGLPPPPQAVAGSFAAHAPPPLRPAPVPAARQPAADQDATLAMPMTAMAPRRPAAAAHPVPEPDPDITLLVEPPAQAAAVTASAAARPKPTPSQAAGADMARDAGPAAPRRLALPLAAGVMLLLAGGGAAWWATRAPSSATPVPPTTAAAGAGPTAVPVVVATAPATGAAVAPTAAPAVATSPASSRTPAPVISPSPAPATTPATVAKPAVPGAATTAAFDAPAEFARVVQAHTPGWSVALSVDRAPLRMEHDQLRFTLHAEQAGYVYLFHYGSDGQLLQLYPNRNVPELRVARGATLKLPAAPLVFNVSGPPGVSQMLAIVSRLPRDHAALAPTQQDGFFTYAPDAAALRRASDAALPPLAGRPRCAKPPCDDAFAAALASYDVLR